MPEQCQIPKVVAGANVTITIKGLAICNYNNNKGNWEAVFLRHVENHNLKIIVKKCRSGTVESSNTYDINPQEKVYVVSDTSGDQSSEYKAEAGNDGVIDFSAPDMYNGKVNFYMKKKFPLSFLSISGGVYYTRKVSKKLYRILKGGVPKETKRIGLGIGADITCVAGGKTEITVANRPNLIPPLLAESGVVYDITFDNDCYEPVVEGECDFDRYYDLIDMPEQFTLELADSSETPAEPVEPMGGEPPPEDDPPPEKNPPCNTAIISDLGSGLTSLSELIEP